jgi:hypothetical protein
MSDGWLIRMIYIYIYITNLELEVIDNRSRMECGM